MPSEGCLNCLDDNGYINSMKPGPIMATKVFNKVMTKKTLIKKEDDFECYDACD